MIFTPEIIKKLPKAELHCHLDGSLRVKTIIELAEDLKIVVEPGGAVAATALLTNKISVKNKNVVVMISGGNIDYKLFSSIVRNC